jgi:hypothetical protein
MATQVQVPTISIGLITAVIVTIAERVVAAVLILMLAESIVQLQGYDIPLIVAPPPITLLYLAGAYALLTRRIKFG